MLYKLFAIIMALNIEKSRKVPKNSRKFHFHSADFHACAVRTVSGRQCGVYSHSGVRYGRRDRLPRTRRGEEPDVHENG